MANGLVKPEDIYQTTDGELDLVGEAIGDFYTYRNYRSGSIRQLQYNGFEDYLRKSRELFWNAIFFESEDLAALDLQLTIPFIRKEVMEFLSRMTQLGIKPRIVGDDLDVYGVKILNSLYQRWRFKSNDKVQKYWQTLYGVINGTTCNYVGFNNIKKLERMLDSYDPATGQYQLTEKLRAAWNDVETNIIPLEDVYLKKISERNIQKQGRIIIMNQQDPSDFYAEYKQYPRSKDVVPGSRITSDSLYFQLLGGTGVTTTNKIQTLKVFDTDRDQYLVVANGRLLNPLGKDIPMPLPFKHKMMPFTWSLNEPIDEKFAYGLSMPFKIKDPHKMMNASYVMLMERELRAINEPILSSDIETPEIVYKTGKVIPVGDVTAYKQLEMSEASQQFFTSLNSMQSIMSSQAQGGSNEIVPSIQPKSAKEISQMDMMRQQAMGSALLMYYDQLRQEILLILKTMLQFYSNEKFSKGDQERVIKVMNIPDMALNSGGIGNVELRLVRESEDPMKLYFEAVGKSFKNGKQTEIIEAPIEFLQNLEFFIKSIDLDTEKSSEIEQSMWLEKANWLTQFVQGGLVDPSKLLLRTLEKWEIYPSDVISDKAMGNAMSAWDSMHMFTKGAGADRSTTMGSFAQSPVGQVFGGQSNGGQGQFPATPMMSSMSSGQ